MTFPSRPFTSVAALSLAWAAILGACGGNVVADPASLTSGTGGVTTQPSSSTSANGAQNTVGTSVGTATSTGNVTVSSSVGTTATATSTTTTATSTSNVSSSVGTTSSTSGSPGCAVQPPLLGPCTPKAPPCPPPVAFGSACLAEIPQAANPVFGMRIAHLTIDLPKSLGTGIVGSVLSTSVAPNDKACGLDGGGSFSWLLQFDTNKGLITTGGAKPVPGPFTPYSFVNEVFVFGGTKFVVAPVVLPAKLAGCNITSGTADVVLPIFTDGTGTQAILFPLHQLQFFKGSFSADHGCVGSYNALGLDPSNACQPDTTHPQFIDGARAGGFLVLAETDLIIVPQLNQSLCVLLSGNAGTYGDGGSPTHCKTSATNEILFQGDWCSSTNAPATASCHDALQFNAGFAASGVAIN